MNGDQAENQEGENSLLFTCIEEDDEEEGGSIKSFSYDPTKMTLHENIAGQKPEVRNETPFEEEQQEDLEEVVVGETNKMTTDSRHKQHLELIRKLRLQLRDLESYAYERGELKIHDNSEIPASVLAKRQNLVLETLQEKLQLNISNHDIEKMDLDDLKKQVDKEIQDLIDPQITKDHLLNQLQTQLSDLERYIRDLHLVIGKTNHSDDCTVDSTKNLTNNQLDLSKLSLPPCSCQLHGCGQRTPRKTLINEISISKTSENLVNDETLPKTSRLIRYLVAQLICTDIKLRERDKFSSCCENDKSKLISKRLDHENINHNSDSNFNDAINAVLNPKPIDSSDEVIWTNHINKVILATDSLSNLFDLKNNKTNDNGGKTSLCNLRSTDRCVDGSLIESVVRRQFVPAIKNLLSYGLIEKNRNDKKSLLYDPYSLISSWLCFPNQNNKAQFAGTIENSALDSQSHVWNVILDYYKTRNEPSFNSSSIKTLSQSFDLAPSISGSIKITSKQALIIAIEDIIETLSKSKPNGPESHFRLFIYNALNKGKLSIWIRLIFRSKSITRRHYHNYSFVSQQDKMDKFLKIIESVNEHDFEIPTDVESIEQFVSAF